VKSVNNLADPLIKGLSRDMVRKTTSRMGLKVVIKNTGCCYPFLGSPQKNTKKYI
jgi:hypothetical protein